MRLGLVAARDTLTGVADTPTLLAAAQEAGVTVRMLDWRADQGQGQDWADALLLHAPWDYTQHLESFRSWLRSASDRQPVFNPWSRIASNSHKGYLLDLAAAGVPIPPTLLLPAGQALEDGRLVSAFGGSPVVVKPAVGSGGRRLDRLTEVSELPSSSLVGGGAPEEDLVVQAFVPSVEERGEYSLVIIGGSSTHLIHKMPAKGQFRVQARFGGRSRRVELDHAAREVEELLRPHVEGLAYARIDYVLDPRGGPLLMELEATEPDLFLAQAPEAAAALLQHVRDRVSGS